MMTLANVMLNERSQPQKATCVRSHLHQIFRKKIPESTCFSSTYIKTRMIQKRVPRPLGKEDMRIWEAFHILKRMWCIRAIEYYSAMTKNKMLLFAVARMDLEIVMRS